MLPILKQRCKEYLYDGVLVLEYLTLFSQQRNEDTKQIAANTMTRLNEQGEQMKRIQGNFDKMEGHFDQAEYELRSINSIWGQFGNSIVGPPKKKYDETSKQDKYVYFFFC